MEEYKIRLIIAGVSFIIGLGIGYVLAKSKSESKLTTLQVASMCMFFGYLFVAGSFELIQYSDLVAITILAITSGEPIGKIIAKQVEKNKKR